MCIRCVFVGVCVLFVNRGTVYLRFNRKMESIHDDEVDDQDREAKNSHVRFESKANDDCLYQVGGNWVERRRSLCVDC